MTATRGFHTIYYGSQQKFISSLDHYGDLREQYDLFINLIYESKKKREPNIPGLR